MIFARFDILKIYFTILTTWLIMFFFFLEIFEIFQIIIIFDTAKVIFVFVLGIEIKSIIIKTEFI